MPDQFPAQGGAEHQPVVAGEAGDARAPAGLHDGEGRAGAFDLAGGGGEQVAGGGQVHAEDGGHLVGGQLVAYGQFERLALLGGGAGGLRPGQQGEFAAAPFLLLLGDGRGAGRGAGPGTALALGGGAAGRVGGLTFLLGLGQLAQARPAGQRVQPGPAVTGGLRGALGAALGEREDPAQGGGGRVVVAQHGQAVREQAVHVGLVARGRTLHQGARRSAVTRLAAGTVCAGGAGHGVRAAAHHPATVGGGEWRLLPR
ncbi:hypothetical protein GCM10020295_34760 [Streptomyces cinereospinus]